MAKKRSISKKEKFNKILDTIALPFVIAGPILTVLILWYIAEPNYYQEDLLEEANEIYWLNALYQTLLIWIPLIGFLFTWTKHEDAYKGEGIGKAISTAIGLLIGTAIFGFIIKFFLEFLLLSGNS